ncbi:MAG: Na+/H+ antiporter subunit B [Planctomycetota bacterium]
MNSLILQAGARALLPFMIVVSIIVLLRGHNEPGGGFVGGLLAASGFALHALACSPRLTKKILRVDPRVMIGSGLLAAIGSGVPAMLAGAPFLEGRWGTLIVPGYADPIKVGTPLIFDIGVYLVVLGVTCLMVFTLEEHARDAARRH